MVMDSGLIAARCPGMTGGWTDVRLAAVDSEDKNRRVGKASGRRGAPGDGVPTISFGTRGQTVGTARQIQFLSRDRPGAFAHPTDPRRHRERSDAIQGGTGTLDCFVACGSSQ
ncbi:hypothetical protein BRAO375_980036 [Bradyrhizobium sp. ORS 375]|nr:hypothetical protein BRAO375_980036 [Bradyrhizobium sp. ORS 375]